MVSINACACIIDMNRPRGLSRLSCSDLIWSHTHLTHTHSLSHTLSVTHTPHTHTLSHTQSLSHTLSLSHTHSLSQTLSLTHTLYLTHTLSHTLSHTHCHIFREWNLEWGNFRHVKPNSIKCRDHNEMTFEVNNRKNGKYHPFSQLETRGYSIFIRNLGV